MTNNKKEFLSTINLKWSSKLYVMKMIQAWLLSPHVKKCVKSWGTILLIIYSCFMTPAAECIFQIYWHCFCDSICKLCPSWGYIKARVSSSAKIIIFNLFCRLFQNVNLMESCESVIESNYKTILEMFFVCYRSDQVYNVSAKICSNS